MSKEDIKGVQVDTLLYTKEGKVSEEKTKAELEVADPSRDKALGVLKGYPTQESGKNEQTTD